MDQQWLERVRRRVTPPPASWRLRAAAEMLRTPLLHASNIAATRLRALRLSSHKFIASRRQFW
jgi:hypothetical protein